MPNWCFTSYAIDGDSREIEDLYNKMHELEVMKEPLEENGFGVTWLGCIVKKLGKDWKAYKCRGSFSDLRMDGGFIRFNTETAWAPCDEVIDLIKEKYESIHVSYITEEPGMDIFETNDKYGMYFEDRFKVDAKRGEKELVKYYKDYSDVLKDISEMFGIEARSEWDVIELENNLSEGDSDDYCYVAEFDIVED